MCLWSVERARRRLPQNIYRVSQKSKNVWLTTEQKIFVQLSYFRFDSNRKHSDIDFETSLLESVTYIH